MLLWTSSATGGDYSILHNMPPFQQDQHQASICAVDLHYRPLTLLQGFKGLNALRCRHGHNEMDEPRATLPLSCAAIDAHPRVCRKHYTQEDARVCCQPTSALQ